MRAAERLDNPPPLEPYDDFWPDDAFELPPPPTLPEADEYQQRVIDAAETSLRVIAPAGAGKTQTLVRRVKRRIDDGVPARRILVLTFDRNAKRSFEAIIQRMGMRARPDIRTLNAFGWDVLRREFPDERFELVKSWHVLGNRGINPAGSKHLLIRQLAEIGDPKDLLAIFDALKDHLFDPRDRAYKERTAWIVANYQRLVPDAFFTRFGERYAAEFASAISDEFRAYERFLASRNAIDYQDQKLRTLRLLQENDRVRERIQQRYDEIIVDEVQDINRLDAELIKTIAEQATLVLTGDDDQAIYEFRWASPQFLIDPNAFFDRTFTTFELSLNYRCPPTILNHALPLIEHNVGRVAKQPRAFKREGGEITVMSASTTLLEARKILAWIEEVRAESPDLRYQDVAVLYRVNAQHYLIQTELFRNRIPYTVNERFDLRIIWRKALTLLEISTKLRGGEPLPVEDRRAAMELYPAFGSLRPADLGWIAGQGTEREKFPGTATFNAIQERLNAGVAGYFRSAMRALVEARTLHDELDVIGSRFLGFSEQGGQEAADESPMEELQEIARKMNAPRQEFIQRFGRFLYSSEIQRGNGEDRGVELSTCHGAKGREWKAVILPSCNEGKFPDYRSTQQDQDLEAERRLFYVSMTRASQRLCISYLKDDEKKQKSPDPSRFLYEAKLLEGPPPPIRNERPGRALDYEPPRPRARSERAPTIRGPGRSGKQHARTSGGRAGRAPAAVSPSIASVSGSGPATSKVPVEELLPPTIILVPGKLKRRMSFPREGDVRRFINELTESPKPMRLPEVEVSYEEPEATYALQLGLIVRGVPYQITEHHRLLESAHFAAVYRTLTNAEPAFQRLAGAPFAGNSAYKGLAIRTLVRVAREFGISSRKGTDVLNDAIRHAVRTQGDADEQGVRFMLSEDPG
ncbi:MAG TPA: ATP-dependent helicase [Thermomicrobiales bacterium]|nr:ATP-dependent helicase [Thermomicrobiales bacterium]